MRPGFREMRIMLEACPGALGDTTPELPVRKPLAQAGRGEPCDSG